jgi:hypothetical protein
MCGYRGRGSDDLDLGARVTAIPCQNSVQIDSYSVPRTIFDQCSVAAFDASAPETPGTVK